MHILRKKIPLTVVFSLLLLAALSSCQPKGKQEAAQGKENKDIPAATKGVKEHSHTDHSEQAGCPICNIQLLMDKGYKEIDIGRLKEMQKSDSPFILINTLPFYFYQKEHIINSINMPLDEIENIAPKILKTDTKIVVYCKDFNCKVSHDSAEKLIKLGYANVVVYSGGMKEWKEKGNNVSGLKVTNPKEDIYGDAYPNTPPSSP